MNAAPGSGFTEVLIAAEMAEADRRAVALGVPLLTLMENAGQAVAEEAAKMADPGTRIAVLCGPGNNGGDGFVAARLLAARGYDVRVALLGDHAALKGDAAVMAAHWSGTVDPLSASSVTGAALIIDALFGAGLSRSLDGIAADAVKAANASGTAILAVDVPSGLNGTTGSVSGPVIVATKTITFFRKKPGHLLFPGRALCGDVTVAGIGIPESVLLQPFSPAGAPRAPREGDGRTFENAAALWLGDMHWPKSDGHKYSRGHAVVVSGPPHQTGAARLGARGALRAGAGLVTLASPPHALLVNAAHLTAIMLTPFGSARDLELLLTDRRKNAVLIGPGLSTGEDTRELVATVLASLAGAVLDADALTSFAGTAEGDAQPMAFGFTAKAKDQPATPSELFAMIRTRQSPVVMTPHDGEFARIFPGLEGSKLERARAAAKASGAIVVLKGPDTVIASPDGRAAINANAPPWLATAGSGDVLAGFITGLLAQGMEAFKAACAGVWLHGACGNAFGIGLIAEDLPEVLPQVLRTFQE